jgi:hypothetical protein
LQPREWRERWRHRCRIRSSESQSDLENSRTILQFPTFAWWHSTKPTRCRRRMAQPQEHPGRQILREAQSRPRMYDNPLHTIWTAHEFSIAIAIVLLSEPIWTENVNIRPAVGIQLTLLALGSASLGTLAYMCSILKPYHLHGRIY